MTLGKQYRYQPPQTLLVHQPLLISIVYFNTLPMVTLIKRGANKSHSKYYPLIVQFPFVRLVKGCKHRPGQTLLTSLSSGSRRSLWRRVATPCQHLSCRLCSQHYTRDCAKISGALSSRARARVCAHAGGEGWVGKEAAGSSRASRGTPAYCQQFPQYFAVRAPRMFAFRHIPHPLT